MEKGHRLAKCPGCPATLRLHIPEQQYEKTVEVTCPKCRARFRVMIPKPTETAQGKPTRDGVSFFEEVLEAADKLFGPLKK